MKKYIGYSVPFCVEDICLGNIKIEDIDKIIVSDNNIFLKSLENDFEEYQSTVWKKFPQKALKVIQELFVYCKIYFPEFNFSDWSHSSDGMWTAFDTNIGEHDATK